jgi:hypothetical protein
VIVLSKDRDLFNKVRATLHFDSRFIDADDGVHCDGSTAPLTNMYPIEMPPAEWDGWQSEDPQMPDPRFMSALSFECRSPTWIAEVGRLLARVWKRGCGSLTQQARLGPPTG